MRCGIITRIKCFKEERKKNYIKKYRYIYNKIFLPSLPYPPPSQNYYSSSSSFAELLFLLLLLLLFLSDRQDVKEIDTQIN